MPYRQREYTYNLDDQLIIDRYVPEIRQFEFKLLIYLYREAGYDTARKYLDGLKRFETERNSPGYVKPEISNQKRRHGNWKRKNPQIIGTVDDLEGLSELDVGQKQTALRMVTDYGAKYSQNYINCCLKLNNLAENQNRQGCLTFVEQ